MLARVPTRPDTEVRDLPSEPDPALSRWKSFRPFAPWVVAGLVAFAAWAWWRSSSGAQTTAPTFRTAKVQRGDIVQSVSATGPLSAVSTVDVGTQVSGNIARLHVDFNDTVKAGQLLAEIEPSTYEARLTQAEGDLSSARAVLELRQLNVRRTQELFARELVSRSDLDTAAAECRQQQGVVQIKEAVLKSARVDLERTRIVSPVDGVVINRAVDVGQTVQASFTAPTLFKLARDLREMEITANVSEADIGNVRRDQPVTFTVDAFPGEAFAAKVRQVRNNTSITNNVVTYPTIIAVENPDLRLRPGMTANVTIILAQRSNVLRVTNSALRFQPPENAVVRPGDAAGGGRTRALYVPRDAVDASGRTAGVIERVGVHAGLSDATNTEIVSGLEEGTVVITGISLVPAATTSGVSNPFVPKMPGPHGPKR